MSMDRVPHSDTLVNRPSRAPFVFVACQESHATKAASHRFVCRKWFLTTELASSSSRFGSVSPERWNQSRISVLMKPMQLKALCWLLLLTSPAQAAEIGGPAGRILFGQAAAMSGPSSALGLKMRQGILAAFAEVNAKGGVHGRKLELISRDDGYDPDRSVLQTVRLLNEDKIFALIGAVGTPTSLVTEPIARNENVPFIGPFTGAGFLRENGMDNVVNIRASYSAEAEAWVKHLTEDRHLKRIAIFYQDDPYGRDGLTGVKLALEKRGMELAAEATYERNTKAVASAMRTLRRAEPEAVVMVGTYAPCAEFIKLARKSGFNPVFVNISFVGAVALAQELGHEGAGVIVSQVVPFPWDASIKVVADYQAAQRLLDPELEPDFVSLEGYLSGRLP